MTKQSVLRSLFMAFALVMAFSTTKAHAAPQMAGHGGGGAGGGGTNSVSACVPAGMTSAAKIAANTALNAGTSMQFTCTVTAGTNYSIELNYDQGAVTPGDAGNYIGFQLFRVNADDSTTLLLTSSPDGNDRETVLKTADGNETWFVKVDNLAINPAYNSGAGVNVYIPGGRE